MMSDRMLPPHRWLDGLAGSLDHTLRGQTVLSAISGSGWVSLRTEAGYLWLLATGGLRLAWLATEPMPRAWLDLLDRHAKSPFATHLGEARIEGVRVLRTGDGQADGLDLVLAPGPRSLRVRYFPRPGALWLESAGGEEIARLGRMEGADLEAVTAGEDPEFDLSSHAEQCRLALRTHLRDRTARVLRQRVEAAEKKSLRVTLALEAEFEQAQADRGQREKADILAAHLHEIRGGAASVSLPDFAGDTVEIELDPALSPAANLDRWYKRAARAERKVEQLEERVEVAQSDLGRTRDLRSRVQDLLESDGDLDAWLALASELELSPLKESPKKASERGRPDPRRLPYWTFHLDGFELRVGRSAKDNDELTRRHADGRDLWLHAQGVSGSHVVIRSGGRTVSERTIERAAQVAAEYSRSRTSSLVPVLVVEKRYVRKPRKAPAGQVSVERARTVFVAPGIPKGCTRREAVD